MNFLWVNKNYGISVLKFFREKLRIMCNEISNSPFLVQSTLQYCPVFSSIKSLIQTQNCRKIFVRRFPPVLIRRVKLSPKFVNNRDIRCKLLICLLFYRSLSWFIYQTDRNVFLNQFWCSCFSCMRLLLSLEIHLRLNSRPYELSMITSSIPSHDCGLCKAKLAKTNNLHSKYLTEKALHQQKIFRRKKLESTACMSNCTWLNQ